jgi:hypothetical protein
MDCYFLRDIFIFLTYLSAVQWGMYIERSYGCTPAQDVLDFTPRCYSLPLEDLQSPKETEETVVKDATGLGGASLTEETEGADEDDARKRWEHWMRRSTGPVMYVGRAPQDPVQYVREADATAGEL